MVQEYALIENALAAAEGLSGEVLRDEIAALWARFNEVATRNPDAAFGGRGRVRDRDAWAAQPSARLPVQPAALDAVDGGPVLRAADLLGGAGGRGGCAASTVGSFPTSHCTALRRSRSRPGRNCGSWPAMGVLGRAAEAHLGPPLRELRLAEVYSCFPAAVRVQQRELGLDPSGTPTLTGGMAFAGGPFNHYVLQSLATLGRRLRDEPDELGLVTTVSGMLSKPGLAVWSASPPRDGSLLADLAEEALAATDVRPVVASPPTDEVAATVASFTVTYGGRGRSRARARGHRRGPGRWGPHGGHLRRCSDRPLRHRRGPHRPGGQGEGHDISTVNAPSPRPSRPRLVDPDLAARVPGLRRVAGVALLLAALSAVAIVVQRGGARPRGRPLAAAPRAAGRRDRRARPRRRRARGPRRCCTRRVISRPWARPTASWTGCGATSCATRSTSGRPGWPASAPASSR